MTQSRFYCADSLVQGALVPLSENVARHAVRVLRMQEGDCVTLFDGGGGEFQAVIQRIQKDKVLVEVGAWHDREVESPLRVTLVQALQAADKMDYTLQKSVELGVAAVQPVSSRRSVVRLSGEREQKRVQHWQGVVASACEQCGRNQVPVVAPVESLVDWLARPGRAGVGRIMLAPGGALSLKQMPAMTEVELLIGAEGGLDPQEIALAKQVGFMPVVLGPRILRTETAGLAALAAMQILWGDC